MSLFPDFSILQILVTGLIFVWTGFVRTGLGFGGAALGLPLLLFVHNDPIFWLPMIGIHLLFFSALTLLSRLNNVSWKYLRQSALIIVPTAIAGVFGLLNLPLPLLLIFIYTITLTYALIWLFNLEIRSNTPWLDRILLAGGGYIAGTTLSGAPLIVAVYVRHVPFPQLRNTLFVLWFTLVSIKLCAFVLLGVELHVLPALSLLPVAAIGHYMGLKIHEKIVREDRFFKKFIGGGLLLVSVLGLLNQDISHIP